jgi:hypothetical protein
MLMVLELNETMAIVSIPDGVTPIKISIGYDFFPRRYTTSKFWKKHRIPPGTKKNFFS